MTADRSRLAWAPAFAVGASAAIALEVAMALLLYTGPGLVRSLTAVLAVGGVTFAAGLWSAGVGSGRLADRLRRRWLFCLFAFLAAAVFGVAWSFPGLLPDGRLTQAAGLAILAVVPLFAAGSALGSLSPVAPLGPVSSAAAAIGAGAGFVLTGVLLPRSPLPSSLLLVCLVLLSLGGMLLGAVLDDVSETEVRDVLGEGEGAARVEVVHRDGTSFLTLSEGRHARRVEEQGREAEVPWEVAVARALLPTDAAEWSVLVVGGGASSMSAALGGERPDGTVVVLERSPAVVELARRHFDTGAENGRCRVCVGNLEDSIKEIRERFDVVVVDERALAPLGGGPSLSREARGRLAQAVAPHGALVWGPCGTPAWPTLVEGWRSVTLSRECAHDDEVVHVMAPGSVRVLPAVRDGFSVEGQVGEGP